MYTPELKDAAVEKLRKVFKAWVDGDYPQSALEGKVFAYILSHVWIREKVLKNGMSALNGWNAEKAELLSSVGEEFGIAVAFANLTRTVEGYCACIFDDRDKIYDDYYYYGPKPKPVMDHISEVSYSLSEFIKPCGTKFFDDKKLEYDIEEEDIAQRDHFASREPDEMSYNKAIFVCPLNCLTCFTH
jgi:hypothetical protein